MSEDSLGDRMKGYEGVFRSVLPGRMPVIMRLDGRAFHSFTRGCKKPYDRDLMKAMDGVALKLCAEVNNCQMAYVQSDEISLLLFQKSIDSQQWFGGNVQKMCSVAAAIASVEMTLATPDLFSVQVDGTPVRCSYSPIRRVEFDARVFALPVDDVCNYFVWRQQDWIRNSVQMLARSLYSQAQLHGKGQPEMHEMCFQKGHNWAHLDTDLKNGRCIVKREVQLTVPAGPNAGQVVVRPKWVADAATIFSQNRGCFEAHLTRDATVPVKEPNS